MDGPDPINSYKPRWIEQQAKGGDVEGAGDTTHKETNNSLVHTEKKKYNIEIMFDLNNIVEVSIVNVASNYVDVLEHAKLSRISMINTNQVQMRTEDLSPSQRNTSWKRILPGIINREYYVELPDEIDHIENGDPITASPTP